MGMERIEGLRRTRTTKRTGMMATGRKKRRKMTLVP
jgi:hypothetical protein